MKKLFLSAWVYLAPPGAGIYTTFVMLMNTSSVMLTVLVLNLHHRNECRPVPPWLRTFALVGLARLLCMYSKETLTIFPQDRRKSSVFVPSDFLLAARFSASSESTYAKRGEQTKRPSACGVDAKSCRHNSAANNSASSAGKIARSNSHASPVARRFGSAPCDVNSRKKAPGSVGGRGAPGVTLDDVDEPSVKAPPPLRRSVEEAERVVLPGEVINLEMQEWKQLARIMDRLFFWLTLTALISVSVVLSCLALRL